MSAAILVIEIVLTQTSDKRLAKTDEIEQKAIHY